MKQIPKESKEERKKRIGSGTRFTTKIKPNKKKEKEIEDGDQRDLQDS